MRSKGKTSPISIYDKATGKILLPLLFILTFFIRFPFFFRDYIDRDESTFILVGQALAEGYLPYTHLWDLKPPVIFFVFAGVISLFGKSFVAIRLFGVFAVALTAFFTYRIGEHVFSKKIGLWCSIGTIVLLSLFGSVQGVMSEHVSILFLMPGLLLLISKNNNSNAFFAGLLIGLAVMTKINLAYAALFIALFLLVEKGRKGNWVAGLGRSLWFGSAILIIVGLTILPYLISNQFQVWWKSVVLAPLEYTRAEPFAPEKILPFVILITAFFLYAWKKRKIAFGELKVQLLFVTILGVCFSFVKGGKVNGHYLIQLYPSLLLFVGAWLSTFRLPKQKNWLPIVIALFFLLPIESYREYYAIYTHKKERGTYFNGEGIRVPLYLKAEALDKKGVLFLEYHIGYWLLDQYPPSQAATHPTNLCRDELFPYFDNPRNSSLEELAFIMEDLKPRTLVRRKNKRIFDKKEVAANQYMNHYINDHYRLHATLDNAEIYLRLELQ